MAIPSRIEGDTHFAGDVAFLAGVNLPDAVVDDDTVTAAADIGSTKVRHLHALHLEQVGGTDVVAETRMVHVAKEDGELVAVNAVCSTAPTGGDKKLTVDVKASTGGGAFASLLDAAFDLDSGDSNLVPVDGTVAGDPSFSSGDVIEIVVTVSGSTGSQAQGLCVTAIIEEVGA